MQDLSLNLAYLQTSLSRVDLILRYAVRRAQAAGFTTDNEFQGLYVTESELERYLSLPPAAGLWDVAGETFSIDDETRQEFRTIEQRLLQIQNEAYQSHQSIRLLELIRAFNLTDDDLTLLLVSLAPALDRRYERIYGFLQDDVTKRRPTINLVINFFGQDWSQRVRLLQRLTDESPLVQHAIISVVNDTSDPHAPYLSHFLKVDSRIVSYLQGVDAIPEQWQAVLRVIEPFYTKLDDLILEPESRQIAQQRFENNAPIYHLYGIYGSGKQTLASVLSAEQGYPLLELDLQTLKDGVNGIAAPKQVKLALREGRLRHAALLVSKWDVILDTYHDPPAWLWAELLKYPYPVILSGQVAWEPRGMIRDRPILRIELEVPEFQSRLAHWKQLLDDPLIDPSELAYKFKLTGGQIRDAVYTAYDLALAHGKQQPSLPELYAASRAQSNRKLSNLAMRIPHRFSWDDIVLPQDRINQLHEICNQINYAVQVYETWGFRGRGAKAHGVTALFAGQSGTGKTMGAGILATELGLELFKIDLSTVVSKYIGETEKNLSAIFDEAAQSNAILFFDEADALFGKRSEVKDSHDRYANIETGYLLQRMEDYDGIAILATNLRQNLDEAFTRRLDFMVDFPFPEEEDRLKIWQISFPVDVPFHEDVDLWEVAQRYRMAGGNIRNAAVASAFLAAADHSPIIQMRHILHAIRREHQKMGKLLEEDDMFFQTFQG